MPKLLTTIVATLLFAAQLKAEVSPVERRPEPPPPGQGWKTLNHFRIAVDTEAARGVPVVAEVAVAPSFNPDSVRVFELQTANIIDVKVEWRTPMARIMWRSTGVQRYEVYFDNGGDGETERLIEPAMVGAGDRVSYGRPNVRGRLGTGLHPHPAPVGRPVLRAGGPGGGGRGTVPAPDRIARLRRVPAHHADQHRHAPALAEPIRARGRGRHTLKYLASGWWTMPSWCCPRLRRLPRRGPAGSGSRAWAIC